MLHQKNEFSRLDCPYAEKKKDINHGDIVLITGEAKTQPNRFNPEKNQTVIRIETKNGNRYLNLNEKSANILIDEFKSNNDKDWIGKEVKVLLDPTVIGGKKVMVAYLVGKSWELDEYGEPVNPGAQKETEDIPTIDIPEEGEDISNSVPF